MPKQSTSKGIGRVLFNHLSKPLVAMTVSCSATSHFYHSMEIQSGGTWSDTHPVSRCLDLKISSGGLTAPTASINSIADI